MEKFYIMLDELDIYNPYWAEIYELNMWEQGKSAEQQKWEYEQNRAIQDESIS